jgi:FMN phosphatase YigB (HAD superfamily)
VDLDNTITPSIHLYAVAIWKCGLIISNALRHFCPYPPKLLQMQQDLDLELMQTMGYSIDRFPSSWLTVYRKLAEMAGVGVDLSVERKLLKTARGFMNGPFLPYPGAVEALLELKERGHTLYLISAGASWFQQRKIDDLGIRNLFAPDNIYVLDGTTSDCKRETFEKVFGPDPENSVMVGDSKGSDLEPVPTGVTTVWVPSHTWSFSESKNPVEPSFTIASLAQLPALIRTLE